MVTVDVLERHVPRVPDAATRLHGAVGGIACQPVGSVVAHRDQVGAFHVVIVIEHPCRVAHQLPQHRCLGVQFDQRKLDSLIRGQLLAPRDTLIGVRHRLVDAKLGSTERRGSLSNSVLVNKVLSQFKTSFRCSEHRIKPNPNVGQTDLGMIGWHVERPPEKLDLEPNRIGRYQEGGDAFRVALLAAGASKNDVVRCVMQTTVPALHPVQYPLVPIANSGGLHVGCVAAMVRLGQTKSEPAAAIQKPGHPLCNLLRRTKVTHHQHGRKVANNARFVLEIVEQTKALRRQMLPNERHGHVACGPASELGWKRQPKPAGGIGTASHFTQ